MRAHPVSGKEFGSRQATATAYARRARFIARIEALSDAPERWEFLFAVLEQQLDTTLTSPVRRPRPLKILYRHPSPAPNGSRWAAKSRYRKPRRGRRPDARRERNRDPVLGPVWRVGRLASPDPISAGLASPLHASHEDTMQYVNGHVPYSKQPWNPALAGPELRALRERLVVAQRRERSLDQPSVSPTPSRPVDPPRIAPARPGEPELPFDPPLPPAKKRRSRARGKAVRGLMGTTGRSQAYCQQLLRIIESGDPWIISRLLMHRISVNRAASLL